MSIIEIFLIALALSMDAFAVAVCLGLRHKASAKNMLIVGLYFGIFQFAMAAAGYYAATFFADSIESYDHWIAFALLTFLGVRMIVESFEDDDDDDGGASLGHRIMIPLAVATSIDSLAVGISFALIHTEILSAAVMIGIVTFVLSMIGVRIGSLFGSKISSKAELVGGIILILIGVKILLEHLDIF